MLLNQRCLSQLSVPVVAVALHRCFLTQALFYCPESAFVLLKPETKLRSLYSVVKEEISDDNAKLPCFNGRVVSWVS